MTAVIQIGIDPFIEIGPLTVAWHGLTIAFGLLAGGWMATRYAREQGLRADAILPLISVLAISGIVGARIFYLLENDAGTLLAPGEWLGTTGFSFYGGIIFGVPAAGAYLRWHKLGLRYLDALAAGFPLGTAVGRIGDVINGEHYGPPSELPWAVRNTHPDADVPSNQIAYHSGGLYEVALGLLVLALIWPLRDRFRRPGTLLCAVVGLYASGRFVMFFARSDSDELLLGLNGAQWTSLGLLLATVIAASLLLRFAPR